VLSKLIFFRLHTARLLPVARLVEGDRLRAEVPREERFTRFNYDAPLIATFMDRWQPETHTFPRRRRSSTCCSHTWQSGRLRRTSRTSSSSEHRLHDGAAWVAYLQWYLPRTRTRVTYVPATLPPPPVSDHDRVLADAMYPVR
jgi:hypothetical protein